MKRWLVLLLCVAGVGWWWWLKGPSLTQPPSRERRGPTLSADAQPGDDGVLEPLQISSVDIRLSLEPAQSYGQAKATAADRQYAALVAKHRPNASYDPSLARAATEYAASAELIGAEPPDRAMAFLLHSSGAADYTAARYAVLTNKSSLSVVAEALRVSDRLPAEAGWVVVGAGEAEIPGSSHARRVAVLTARRFVDLKGVVRRVAPGQTWRIRGRRAPDISDVVATVLDPSGRLYSVTVETDGERIRLEVPTLEPGTIWLSLDGSHPSKGPFKLAQISVEVGKDLPRDRRIKVPPEEEWTNLAAAEAYALRLLNEDRRRLELPELAPDPELAKIARRHSREMAEERFFGHRSATTGFVADRLEGAGYRARAFAENLARNDSIAEAQAALMWSVGHRRNLVSKSYERVGIGVAEDRRGERSAYLVTQVFATPVVRIEPERARDALLERINLARTADGVSALDFDRSLSSSIASVALRASTEPSDDLAKELVERSRGQVKGAAQVVVLTSYNLVELELPEAVLSGRYEYAAIAVAQDPNQPRGRIGVAIIVAN